MDLGLLPLGLAIGRFVLRVSGKTALADLLDDVGAIADSSSTLFGKLRGKSASEQFGKQIAKQLEYEVKSTLATYGEAETSGLEIRQAASSAADAAKGMLEDSSDRVLLEALTHPETFLSFLTTHGGNKHRGDFKPGPEQEIYDRVLKIVSTKLIELVPTMPGVMPAALKELLLQFAEQTALLSKTHENTETLISKVDALATHGVHSPQPGSWPITVGSPPELAAAYQRRDAARQQIEDGWGEDSGTVIVTQMVAGDGGVGKSQLARGMFEDADADLRVWANASTLTTLQESYANAAKRVSAPGSHDPDVKKQAKAFLAWLRTAPHSWFVVLDDLWIEPREMGGWWPVGNGRTLATTRRNDAAFEQRVVNLDVFRPEEALSYLTERLSGRHDSKLDGAEELAEALGYLPLGLAQATAVIIDQHMTCAEYLVWFNETDARLDELFPEESLPSHYARTVATTWHIAMQRAEERCPHAGRAAVLASVVDPVGAPEELWLGEAGRQFLSPDGAIEPREAKQALATLARFSIINYDGERPGRQVSMHKLAQLAVAKSNEYGAEVEPAQDTAIAGLVAMWNDRPAHTALDGLHSNSELLEQTITSEQRPTHPLRMWLTRSLRELGFHSRAIERGEADADALTALVGPTHPDILRARHNLASSYWAAGRYNEAILLQEQVLNDSETVVGLAHSITLNTRGNLALSYWAAGRYDEAIPLQEKVLKDREILLGPTHPDTLITRGNLASSYWAAGRYDEAIPLQEKVLKDREILLGPTHPDTLRARGNLAISYQAAGRTTEAIHLFEQVLDDFEILLGPAHPDTLKTRNNLASSYWAADRYYEAIQLQEQVLKDTEEVLGKHHPNTIAIRRNLIAMYRGVGRDDDADKLEQGLEAEDG